MKKIKDIPPEKRPRERLIKHGAQSLSDLELLMVLIGKGVKGHSVSKICQKLLKLIDKEGFKIKIEDILKITGMASARAGTILAACEFFRRRISPRGFTIKSPDQIMPLLWHYGDRRQEHFIAICLNAAGEVIATRVITIGLINQTQIHPREVFADAITDRASSVILAHNHPSGNLEPSAQDLQITKNLKQAGEILGIKVLDHIIFSQQEYYSLLEHKQL